MKAVNVSKLTPCKIHTPRKSSSTEHRVNTVLNDGTMFNRKLIIYSACPIHA